MNEVTPPRTQPRRGQEVCIERNFTMPQASTRRQTEDNPLLEAALGYAARGLPVFPCKRADKSPLTRHGFNDASTDPEQIREWWTQWPNAMIGMPTGAVSGIDVLDLDVKPDEYI